MMGIPNGIWIYLTAVNLVGMLLFAVDKRKAVRGTYRISEKTLFAAAAIGGSAGALAGMYLFHHKTKKNKFRIGIPMIMMLQIFLWYTVGRMIR